MTAASAHQNSAVIQISEIEPIQEVIAAPVALIGHKSTRARKKGLSLVSYPKSFLKEHSNRTRGFSSKRPSKPKTTRAQKAPANLAVNSNAAAVAREETFSPPLQVVNS